MDVCYKKCLFAENRAERALIYPPGTIRDVIFVLDRLFILTPKIYGVTDESGRSSLEAGRFADIQEKNIMFLHGDESEHYSEK